MCISPKLAEKTSSSVDTVASDTEVMKPHGKPATPLPRRKSSGRTNKRYKKSKRSQKKGAESKSASIKLNPRSVPFVPKSLEIDQSCPTSAVTHDNANDDGSLNWMKNMFNQQQFYEVSEPVLQEITGKVVTRCTESADDRPFALALKMFQHPLVKAVHNKFGTAPESNVSKNKFSTEGPPVGRAGYGRVRDIRGNWGFIRDSRYPSYDLFFHLSEIQNEKDREQIDAGSQVRFQVVVDKNQVAKYARVKAAGVTLQKRKHKNYRNKKAGVTKKQVEAAKGSRKQQLTGMRKEQQSFP